MLSSPLMGWAGSEFTFSGGTQATGVLAVEPFGTGQDRCGYSAKLKGARRLASEALRSATRNDC